MASSIMKNNSIHIKNIKVQKSPGLIINNFFTLITIVIISLTLLWWVNFIVPSQTRYQKLENPNLSNLKNKRIEKKLLTKSNNE